jgi:hypothetical protein
MELSIQDLGAIGEFVSSIVVLFTLIYLAIQTNLTRKATQANLQWTRANASRELSLMWANNPDTVKLIEEFGRSEFALKPSDEFNPRAFQYISMNRAIMDLHQAFYMTAQTDQDLKLVMDRIKFQMTIPGFVSSWPVMKHSGMFYPEFIVIVERALEERAI